MGLNPGYGDHTADATEDRIAHLVNGWQELSNRYFEHSGMTITCVMTEGRALYHSDRGCPKGGEKVIILTGTSNPAFVEPKHIGDYAQLVHIIIDELRNKMEQTTCLLEFQDMYDVQYLRDATI